MTDVQRKRIFEALMGPAQLADGGMGNTFAELVMDDIRQIEPIIDEFINEAAKNGLPKPC